MQEKNIIAPISAQLLEYVRADRAVRSAVGSVLDAQGTTLMQWLLLSIVCEGAGEGVTMSTAARALNVTLPQVTALTNELLKSKLIKQKTQAFDRRTRLISPTPKGTSLMQATATETQAALDSIFSEVSSDDKEVFWRLVRLIGKSNP